MQFANDAAPAPGHNPASAKCAGKEPLWILKFGSSVLRSVEDLPRAAGEIYRQRRKGRRIVAVVSAFEGETDQLIAACSRAAGDAHCSGQPEVISLGEEKAAFLLAIACDRIGLRAKVVRGGTLGIGTRGSIMDAEPVALSERFAHLVEGASDVIIVPGFVGVDSSGCRSLLGRGGSDFSAIFLGGETGAHRTRLYKDVDGVYDHDPARWGAEVHRFDHVSWQDCLTLARPLLQPRAVEYARSKALAIEVGSIGCERPTIVADETRPPSEVVSNPPLRIGLLGFGTVGQALAERLEREPSLEIISILVRDTSRERRVPPPVALTADVGRFLATDFDVLVDVSSGEDVGMQLCTDRLTLGGHVVSANKLVIANNLEALHMAAVSTGSSLFYSATVGGSAPMLESLLLARSEGEIIEVTAVLNGTINFLLDRIASGASFDAALDSARRIGFAEEDPAADLSSQDAVLKLRILASAAFDSFDSALRIDAEPFHDHLIEEVVGSSERWIQVSALQRVGKRISGSVRFMPAHRTDLIGPPAGEGNFIRIKGTNGKVWTASGRGAGGAATAEAVVADLFDLRNRCTGSAASSAWSNDREKVAATSRRLPS